MVINNKNKFLKTLINKIYFSNSYHGKLITFLNPYSYIILRKEHLLLDYFDIIFFDGIILVALFSFLKIKKCYRISFDMTSLAPFIFDQAQRNNQTIYFIGTKPGIIELAIQNVKNSFPKLNIIGFRHGYFKNQLEREQVLEEICILNPDIVIAGMGTPLQEYFLIDLRSKGWQGTGFTCGGFLHQTAKNIEYYPKWIDKFNLRWLYRIYDEPKLFKRYFYDYSKFLIYFILDYYRYRKYLHER